MDEDDFYALRTAYYLGDYGKVEQENSNLNNLSGMKAKERDSYLIRSLVAQRRFKEALKLAKGEASAIVACKQLIGYKQCKSDDAKDVVIDKLREYLKEASYLENNTFCVVAAGIFLEQKMYREALELAVSANNRNHSDGNLEKLLMEAQIYLSIGRADLALKALQKMQELEDDDALTQIANIVLCLYHGGQQKVTDGLELIEDLISGNSATIQLINMQCAANMHLKNWTTAWKLCKQSRDLAKQLQTTHPSFVMPTATLINSITCLQNLNKGQEILPKLYEQLNEIDPEHEFVKQNEEMMQLFEKSAKNFKV